MIGRDSRRSRDGEFSKQYYEFVSGRRERRGGVVSMNPPNLCALVQINLFHVPKRLARQFNITA